MRTHVTFFAAVLAAGVIVGLVQTADPEKRPGVSGDWVGTWGAYSPPKDGEPPPSSKYTKEQLRLDCRVAELRDGKWEATFEGECGRPYKYTIKMSGRQVGEVVLFQGSADLGEKDGGVYDWIGRATETEFVGFYTSKKYTGHFRLARAKESQPAKTPASKPAKPAPPPEKGSVRPDRLGYENDFTPGRTPSKEEIAAIEKEVAANPDDFKLVRKLGTGYFYRVFGAKEAEAAPKAQKTLARALELKKDDALTIAFQATLASLAGKDLPDLKGRTDELFKKARELEPNNVGILSLATGVYAGNPEKAIEITERIRKLLGPEFKNWSRHGQQQVLITQGKAYARAGRLQEARACFEDGLAVNRTLFQAELDRLKK